MRRATLPPAAIAAALVVAGWTLAALFAPFIAPFPPGHIVSTDSLAGITAAVPISTGMEEPSEDTTTSAASRLGIEISASSTRLATMSNHPPRAAAVSPRVTPMVQASEVEISAMPRV